MADRVVVHHGDCIDVLRTMPDNSVHAVVTDPPYNLAFMGRGWDTHDSPRAFQAWCELWAAECLRVLTPGGHLLAFGGTRTGHRLVAGVEDAGFEVRDSIAWLYGSGFPKSRNVGAEVAAFKGWGTALKPAFEPIVVARKPPVGTVAANVLAWGTGALNIDACRVATDDNLGGGGFNGSFLLHGCRSVDELRELAAVNAKTPDGRSAVATYANYLRNAGSVPGSMNGRWPANVALDGSQADALDQQSGIMRDGVAVRRHVGKSGGNFPFGAANPDMREDVTYGGSGGASRFFPTFRYQAKAPTTERPSYVTADGRKISHPTVKPLGLMRWLVRLVTPPGGTVLDPFAGSGATLEAALIEGFPCIGIELDPDSLPLIRQRIDRQAGTLDFGEGEPA